MAPLPIVIDTDIGADPDDALALAFAVASPELEVRSVTVVDGDVERKARMAARVLGMAGRADIPVFIGEERPLGPGRGPTTLGFEGRGLLDLAYDGPEARIAPVPAPAWLAEKAARRPYHLVAIGPLTNVARALQARPALAHELSGLTVMGGVVDERALPRPIREDIVRRGVHAAWPDHNTASDPEAALICARSGALLTWVPGEVTFAVPLRRAIGDALPTDRWLTLALEGMTAAWDAWWRDHGAALGASTFLHDPLTVSALLAPGWLTLRACALRHEIADGVFRLREDAAGEARARVAVAADGARFERVMLGRIARHLRTAGVPRAG